MRKLSLYFLTFAFAQMWTMADTLGWWRMDSVDGVLPETMTNYVNAGVLDATVSSYNGNTVLPLASTND